MNFDEFNMNSPFFHEMIRNTEWTSKVFDHAKEEYVKNGLDKFNFTYQDIEFHAEFNVDEGKEYFSVFDETGEVMMTQLGRFVRELRNNNE